MSSLLNIVKNDDGVMTVTLTRADVHNAFNAELISELTNTFKQVDSDESVRLVVLTGEGSSFCAGADLNWMKSMKGYSIEENIEDSKKLHEMFDVINKCKKPVLGKINGAALGGGVGLLSVCDYVMTHNKTKFGFTEVRLGLIPAVISPFVIKKIGETNARAYFLSGEKFEATVAKDIGLVHKVVSVESFEEDFKKTLESFLQAAPEAARGSKDLIKEVLSGADENYTTKSIANKRVSIEGQEGMNALLEKRKPRWSK